MADHVVITAGAGERAMLRVVEPPKAAPLTVVAGRIPVRQVITGTLVDDVNREHTGVFMRICWSTSMSAPYFVDLGTGIGYGAIRFVKDYAPFTGKLEVGE